MVEEDEEVVGEKATLFKVLAALGFVAALVVLASQLCTADVWINARDSEMPGDWAGMLTK